MPSDGAYPIPGSRAPTRWTPLGIITVKANADPVPLGGVKLGRLAMWIRNTGVTVLFAGPNSNKSAVFMTIPAGAAVTIPTEDIIYLYSVDGATADCVEYWYELTVNQPGQLGPGIQQAIMT